MLDGNGLIITTQIVGYKNVSNPFYWKKGELQNHINLAAFSFR